MRHLHPDLSHLHTQGLLIAAFADFSITEHRDDEAKIPDGLGHSGRSALVDLVARR